MQPTRCTPRATDGDRWARQYATKEYFDSTLWCELNRSACGTVEREAKKAGMDKLPALP
jgi:hypothetical protein